VLLLVAAAVALLLRAGGGERPREPALPPPPLPPPVAESPSDAGVDDVEGGLSAELEALHRVTSALDLGAWQLALEEVERYSARFPKGILQSEASALRVRVHCARGAPQAAVQSARELQRQDPGSTALQGLRRTCVQAIFEEEK
jgi:hypothetical protein